MIKKILFCCGIILLGLLIFYFSKKNIIVENYDYVNIKKNISISIYNKHYIDEFISFKKDGKLLKNELLNTDVIGEKSIEFIYIINNKKYKAKLNYLVIDDVAPLILGGNNYILKKGNNQDLRYVFFSADNYDQEPIREIIGEYNINEIGSYNLVLKVTDKSGNETTKDFVLKIVNNITPAKTNITKTQYNDIVNNYKNENTSIGIDVSRWQENIDYDLIKNNNVEFIMIRVGFQSGFNGEEVLDSYFINNIINANRVGIPVGLYFYSYATTIEEAKKQALWVIDQIKEYQIDLPISFDWETWNKFSTLKLSLHDINEISRTFIETINKSGYIGMNYSSKYYLEIIWNLPDYPAWLAHYTKNTNYDKDYYLWQMANDGVLSGINGPVDINIMNKKSIWHK